MSDAAAAAPPTFEQMTAMLQSIQAACATEDVPVTKYGFVSAEQRGLAKFVSGFPKIDCTNVELNRAAFAGFKFLFPQVPAGVKFVEAKEMEKAAGVKGNWAKWPGCDESEGAATILYLHGGAFTAGSVFDHYLGPIANVSRVGCIRVLALEYGLAPENTIDNIVLEAEKAFNFLVNSMKIPPHKIGVMGDSAGGTLALLLTQRLLAQKPSTRPGCVSVESAVGDWFDISSESWQTNVDPMISAEVMRGAMQTATRSDDATAKRASPIYYSFRGFPPLRLAASRGEALWCDTVALAEKARAAGAPVKLEAIPGGFHIAAILGNMPEGPEYLARAVQWVIDQIA